MAGTKKKLSPEFVDSDSDALNEDLQEVPASSTASQSSDERATSNSVVLEDEGSDNDLKEKRKAKERKKGKGKDGVCIRFHSVCYAFLDNHIQERNLQNLRT